MHLEGERYYEASARMLTQHGIPFSRWPAREVENRYPVLKLADDEAYPCRRRRRRCRYRSGSGRSGQEDYFHPLVCEDLLHKAAQSVV